MREGPHIVKRLAETLDLGTDDDLFGTEQPIAAVGAQVAGSGQPVAGTDAPLSFGEALRTMLGSTTSERKAHR